MRVRMLKNHSEPYRDPQHGELTLTYPVGSTQHLNSPMAAMLIRDGLAVEDPETSTRVQFTRAYEGEIAGVEHHFAKGELVNMAIADAEPLLIGDDPVAVAAPDPEYDPIGATRKAAIDRAIAAKLVREEAAQRRAAMKAKAAAAVAATTTDPTGGGMSNG